MTTRTSRQQTRTDSGPDAVRQMRTMAQGSAVNLVVVRVAGEVPVRLDLSHAGLPEQQLGMSMGTALIYINPRELHQAGEEFAGRLISGRSQWRCRVVGVYPPDQLV